MPRARCLPTVITGGRSDTFTKGPLSPRAEEPGPGCPLTPALSPAELHVSSHRGSRAMTDQSSVCSSANEGYCKATHLGEERGLRQDVITLHI